MDAKKLRYAAVLIAIVIALAIFATIIPVFLRAALGLLFVLFIPGYIATYAFFSKSELDLLERVSYSIGLSISFVVLTVMFSNMYLGIPIRTSTVIFEIVTICSVFAVIAAAKKSAVMQAIYEKTVKKISLKRGINSRTLKYAAFMIILILLIVNFGISVTSEKQYKYYRDDNAQYLKYDAESGSIEEKTGVTISHPYTIDFENGLAFIGYDMNPTLSKGEKTRITYYFRPSKDIELKELNAVTDFNREEDKDVSVFQKQIQFPSISLESGQIISLSGEMTIPKWVPSETYTIHLSLADGYDRINNSGSTEIGRTYIPYRFDELYNKSMYVQYYYDKENSVMKNAEIAHPITYIFDDKIAFLGYDMTPETVSLGQKYHITYYWKSLAPVKKDYTSFVHITDERGKIKFQQDHDLPLKTSRWKAGDVIAEKYDVTVPENIDEGTYMIRFGLYDASSGERMQLERSWYRDNAAYLGKINVRKSRVEDYYDGNENVRVIDTVLNTSLLAKNISIQNPLILDYGPLVILGYELTELHDGKASNATYYIKAKDAQGNYSIRTVITETDGPGLIMLDTQLPQMEKGEVISLVVPVIVPQGYTGREFIFTFAVKNNTNAEYLESPKHFLYRMTVKK